MYGLLSLMMLGNYPQNSLGRSTSENVDAPLWSDQNGTSNSSFQIQHNDLSLSLSLCQSLSVSLSLSLSLTGNNALAKNIKTTILLLDRNVYKLYCKAGGFSSKYSNRM
jgi:hypothetical protein